MDRLPTELLDEVIRIVASMREPHEKNAPYRHSPGLKALAALRLTCKTFAKMPMINNLMFGRITLHLHPKCLNKIDRTRFTNIRKYIRELRICPPHFNKVFNFPWGVGFGNRLSLGNYFHLLRLQAIWENVKANNRQFPTSFNSANNYMRVWCNIWWDYKKVRQGFREFVLYARKNFVDIRDNVTQSRYKKFISQLPYLRHINFTSGSDLGKHPIKNLPENILLSRHWLDDILCDLPSWCANSALRILNTDTIMELYKVTGEYIRAFDIPVKELTFGTHFERLVPLGYPDDTRSVEKAFSNLRKLNYSPLVWCCAYSSPEAGTVIKRICARNRPTLRQLRIKARNCGQYTQSTWIGFYMDIDTVLKGYPCLTSLELDNLAMVADQYGEDYTILWANMPALKTLSVRQSGDRDF